MEKFSKIFLLIMGFGAIGLFLQKIGASDEISSIIVIILACIALTIWIISKYTNIFNNFKEKSFNKKESKQTLITNNLIKEYLKNENLCKICNNFVKRYYKDIPSLEEMELSILPYSFSINLNKYVINNYYSKNDNSLFSKIISKCNNQILNKRRFKLEDIYKTKNKIDNYNSTFKSIEELYTTCLNKSIIIDTYNIFNYYAFLFIIYYYSKQYLADVYINILNKQSLSLEESESKIVKTLYNNDYDKFDIIHTLIAKVSKLCNYENLYIQTYDYYEEFVNKKLQSFKEEEKISHLLSDTEKIISVSINDTDLMSGTEFEYFIANLFNNMGYKTKLTKETGDQGIDIIATKGKSIVAIQTKCYTNSVGNHAIMEAVAGSKYYNATKCMVITNSTFTKSAKELALVNNVILWDRTILKEKIDEIQ